MESYKRDSMVTTDPSSNESVLLHNRNIGYSNLHSPSSGYIESKVYTYSQKPNIVHGGNQTDENNGYYSLPYIYNGLSNTSKLPPENSSSHNTINYHRQSLELSPPSKSNETPTGQQQPLLGKELYGYSPYQQQQQQRRSMYNRVQYTRPTADTMHPYINPDYQKPSYSLTDSNQDSSFNYSQSLPQIVPQNLPQIVPQNLPNGQAFSSPSSSSLSQLTVNLHSINNANSRLQGQQQTISKPYTDSYGNMLSSDNLASQFGAESIIDPTKSASFGAETMPQSKGLGYIENTSLRIFPQPPNTEIIAPVGNSSPQSASNIYHQISPDKTENLVFVKSPSSQPSNRSDDIFCLYTSSNANNYTRQILTLPSPTSVENKQTQQTNQATQQQQQQQQSYSFTKNYYTEQASTNNEYFRQSTSSDSVQNTALLKPYISAKAPATYQYVNKYDYRHLRFEEKPVKKQRTSAEVSQANKDPNIPGPRRSVRERKAVQRSEFIVPESYEDASLSEDNGDIADDDANTNIQVVQGRGVQLGSIASFVQNYESMRTDSAAIRKLFRALYGTPGHPQIRKRFIFVWSGLPPNVDETYLAAELARYCTVANLRNIGKKLLGLTSGANGRDMKQAWITSLVSILANPQPHVIMLSTMFDSKDSRYNMTSFQLFCSEMRPLISGERPGMSNKELMQILGAKWRMLSPAEKYKYQAMSAQRKSTGGSGRKRGRHKKNEDTSDGEDERIYFDRGDDIGYDNNLYEENDRR